MKFACTAQCPMSACRCLKVSPHMPVALYIKSGSLFGSADANATCKNDSAGLDAPSADAREPVAASVAAAG